MDRRLVITTALLVFALLALLFVEVGVALDSDNPVTNPATAPRLDAPVGVALPDPSPAPEFGTGLLSGDFAPTHLAALSAGSRPGVNSGLLAA
jgi:hypothetical protein